MFRMSLVQTSGRVVTCLGKEFTFPEKLTAKDVLKRFHMLENRDREGHKRCYVAFNEKYGVRALVVAKLVNKALFNVWKVPDWARFLVIGKSGVSSTRWQRFYEHEEMLTQVHEDRLDHLLPFCFEYGRSLSELKKWFGKSAWKKVANNSKHRNRLLASMYICQLRDVVDVPSTLLSSHRVIRNNDVPILMSVCSTYKQALELRNSNIWFIMEDAVHINGGTFPKRLKTVAQWRDWHDELVVKRNSAQREEISATRMVSEHRFVNGEFEAVRLRSPLEIYDEGVAMHHCVGSYANRVKEGEYLVYSLRKGGRRFATIGLKKWVESGFHKQQCYGYCNSEVDTTDFDWRTFLEEVNASLPALSNGR